MVQIQSIRRGKKERRKKLHDENTMACPIPQGGHNDASSSSITVHCYQMVVLLADICSDTIVTAGAIETTDKYYLTDSH